MRRLEHPLRRFRLAAILLAIVIVVGVSGYMLINGWGLLDSFYMVIITIYTVGFGEVRPINTPALNVITIALIVLGCTGIIFLTGALVQFITLSQLNKVMGLKRMNSQIDISNIVPTIRVPTLVVHHKDDGCVASPYSGAEAIMKALKDSLAQYNAAY